MGSRGGSDVGTFAVTVVRQYWVGKGDFDVKHSSYCPNWNMLPLSSPVTDLAVASCTETKLLIELIYYIVLEIVYFSTRIRVL